MEAGNETTRTGALSGGLVAFCENPGVGEAARPTGAPPDAVEEILRWVTPISHFTRTATADCEVGGVQIASGDQVALYFASANRDEAVFDDPFAFRVDRRPNPHLAFGFGEHVCMGAHLARVEIETIFGHLLDRLEWFEQSGPVERLDRRSTEVSSAYPFATAWCSDDLERTRWRIDRSERTGLEVSAVGFGCWEIGGGYGDIEEQEFVRAINRSLDLGVNCFDTAEGYGMGASERALGEALGKRRDEAIIVSKFGMNYRDKPNLRDSSRERRRRRRSTSA